MKVSVIIPVYNAEKYLPRCLDSVLRCTEQELQIVLINDGSKDGSKHICERYAQNDKRILFVDQPNKGVSAARNAGIDVALGEWMFFLDADDYLIDGYYDLIQREMNAEYEFVGFSDYCVRESKVTEDTYPFFDKETFALLDAQKILLATHLLHTCWGKLFRKSVLQKRNVRFPENTRIGEDYLFVLGYFQFVKKAKLINSPILYYCINDESVMQNYDPKVRFQAWIDLTKYALQYYRQGAFAFDDLFYEHQLKNTTSFLYDLCRGTDLAVSYKYIRLLLDTAELPDVLSHVEKHELEKMKRIEYMLLKNGNAGCICTYFKAKSRIKK